MNEELENIKKQQFDNYILAVKEIVINNTKSLMEDDISSLIKEPPLRSMDTINNKFLDIAKTYKIVVDNDNSQKIIANFRNKLLEDLDKIGDMRKKPILDSIDKFNPSKELDIIKIPKKDLNLTNKKINSYIKKNLLLDIDSLLISKIEDIYVDLDSCVKKDKVIDKISKYFRKNFLRQLIENINMKILVKDTTLINGVKEQGERYIFTMTNSRIKDL